MKLFRFAIGLYLSGLVGCAFQPGEAPPELKPVEAQSSSGPSDGALVSWELVAQPEAHKYSVHWQLKDLSLAHGLRLRRESDPGQFREAVAVLDEQGRGTDDQVFEEQIYRYELVASTGPGGAPISLGRWTVKIPRDEVVEGVREISSVPPKVNRLFLTADSVLRTQGGEHTLEVEELYADGATIESFAPDATAAPGAPGRPGGSLHIKAQRGSGRLRVVMRGEAGGHGGVGGAGAPGATGGRGSRGIFHEATGICAAQPGIGQPGATGAEGGKGAPGFSGGSSGALEVILSEPSAITFEPMIEGGRGGNGGAGGAGGPGGAGGLGGEIVVLGSRFPTPFPFPHRSCRPAPQGPSGGPGPQGPVGDTGPAGAIENSCIRNGAQIFGHCP